MITWWIIRLIRQAQQWENNLRFINDNRNLIARVYLSNKTFFQGKVIRTNKAMVHFRPTLMINSIDLDELTWNIREIKEVRISSGILRIDIK